MTGLLIGILVSRTFSGPVGEHFGWQAVYWTASVLMVLPPVLLRRRLPSASSSSRMGYAELIRSLGTLVRKHAVLREASLNGAMMFATFSAFWTIPAFLLEGPHYGERTSRPSSAWLAGAS